MRREGSLRQMAKSDVAQLVEHRLRLGVEAAPVVAFACDALDLGIGQVRRAVDGVGDLAIAHSDLVQPVARPAGTGVLGVVHRGIAGVEVEFAVVDYAADEEGTHRGSLLLMGDAIVAPAMLIWHESRDFVLSRRGENGVRDRARPPRTIAAMTPARS